MLASRAGDYDAALEAFAQALAHARGRNKARLVASIVSENGAVLVLAGRADEAEPLLDEARELFERMGSETGLARLDAVTAGATTPVRS